MPVRSQWRRHQAAEWKHQQSWRPPRPKVLRHRSLDLLDDAGAGDADRPAGLHEMREVVQIQIVGAVVRERVDRDDGVEELGRKRQRPRIRVNRKHAVVDTGIADPLDVLRGAEPQVGGPHLHAELAPQEDRRRCLAAAQIQHPHSGSKIQGGCEPLDEPEGIGPAAGVGEHPVGVVPGGTRKALGHQTGILRHDDRFLAVVRVTGLSHSSSARSRRELAAHGRTGQLPERVLAHPPRRGVG